MSVQSSSAAPKAADYLKAANAALSRLKQNPKKVVTFKVGGTSIKARIADRAEIQVRREANDLEEALWWIERGQSKMLMPVKVKGSQKFIVLIR